MSFLTRISTWPVCLLLCSLATAAESREAIVERVGNDVRYLASDELQGRGVETDGIRLAAEHIIAEYRKYGLKPALPEGSFRQAFNVALGKTRSEGDSKVVLVTPSGTRRILTVETDFQPLQRGGNGVANGELVFVGYGISSEEDQYDDYAGIDVEGKVVVMIRREPQQADPNGAFLGTETSSHAYIDRKLEMAKQARAAGIIFVNDTFTASTPQKDQLSPSAGFGTTEAGLPFVHVKQRIVDEVLRASPLTVTIDGEEQKLASLREVSDYIDDTLQPVSQPLVGWTAEVTTKFDVDSVEAYNLIGVLDGKGPLADETIVVGAHYDHLGFGGYGSRARNRTGEIHYGADDNATGTAAVLEIIRRMTAGPPPQRRIVFICFSGEERGLLGSKHYVANPVFPLEQTVAMLNYDMIGTLRNNLIEVNGVGTADEFGAIVEAADEASPLDIKVIPHPFAGSDHLPFFQKQIPVMFCFTGITPRYHTPDDTFEAINVPGVVSVIDYTESLLRGIDALPVAPGFQNVSRQQRSKVPYLGIMPNLGADADEPGIPIQSVRPGSPALKAGLQVADSILKANATDTDNYSDLLQFMRTAKPGQKVVFTLKRGPEEIKVEAELGAPR